MSTNFDLRALSSLTLKYENACAYSTGKRQESLLWIFQQFRLNERKNNKIKMEEKKGRRRLMASWWNVMNRPDKLSPFFSICLFQPEQITIFFSLSLPLVYSYRSRWNYGRCWSCRPISFFRLKSWPHTAEAISAIQGVVSCRASSARQCRFSLPGRFFPSWSIYINLYKMKTD
jgi:hypothetical protein